MRKPAELTDTEIDICYRVAWESEMQKNGFLWEVERAGQRAIATAAARKALEVASTIAHKEKLRAIGATEWDSVSRLGDVNEAIRKEIPDA